MKLWELALKGREIAPDRKHITGRCFRSGSCFLGFAYIGYLGKEPDEDESVVLEESVFNSLEEQFGRDLVDAAWHLNDDGKWQFDQLAEAVRKVEEEGAGWQSVLAEYKP